MIFVGMMRLGVVWGGVFLYEFKEFDDLNCFYYIWYNLYL